MNAVEIEEAVSSLAEAPFDAASFPYDFLQAFGLNDAGIRKLKTGDANKSGLPGGVLQRNSAKPGTTQKAGGGKGKGAVA